MPDGIDRGAGDIQRGLVSPDTPISEGLRRLDEFARKIIFVVDGERRLAGVVTDGDVRRWIISGRGLDRPVSEAMTERPVVLHEGYDVEEARALFTRHTVDAIPVLDGEGRVVSAVWWLDMLEPHVRKPASAPIPVVVMAGGEGSRLSPYTKVLPKPLLPIGDEPIVELIISRFVQHGCPAVHMTVSYKAGLIKAYFNDGDRDYDVRFWDENEPMGTAGGLSLLRGHLDSTFFVTNCDILVDADYGDVLRFHRERGNRMTIVGSLKHFTIPYGVCEVAGGGRLTGITEKPSFDYIVSTGMYVMEPEVLDDIPVDRRFDITELIAGYLRHGTEIGVYPISEKAWLDMGQLEQLEEMRARLTGE
jgi:dTDP-glucose pyrophosphorylase